MDLQRGRWPPGYGEGNSATTVAEGSAGAVAGQVRGRNQQPGKNRSFHDPDLLERAKAEFHVKTEGKPYLCPIPDDVLPASQRS